MKANIPIETGVVDQKAGWLPPESHLLEPKSVGRGDSYEDCDIARLPGFESDLMLSDAMLKL